MSKIKSVCVDHECRHEFNDRHIAEIMSHVDYVALRVRATDHLRSVDLDPQCERLIMIAIDFMISPVISDTRVRIERSFEAASAIKNRLYSHLINKCEHGVDLERDSCVECVDQDVLIERAKIIAANSGVDLDDALDVDHTFDNDAFWNLIFPSVDESISDGVDLESLVTRDLDQREFLIRDLRDDSIADDVHEMDHDLVIKIHNEYKIKFQF